MIWQRIMLVIALLLLIDHLIVPGYGKSWSNTKGVEIIKETARFLMADK